MLVQLKPLVMSCALLIATIINSTSVTAQTATEPTAFLKKTFVFPDQPAVEVPAELSAVPLWTVVSNGSNPNAAPSTWCNAWVPAKGIEGWDADDCVVSITEVTAATYDYQLPADRRQWLRFWATRPQNFVFVVPSFAADQAEMLARVEAADGVDGAIVNDPTALASLFRSELDELKADVETLQGDVGTIAGFLDPANDEGLTKTIEDVVTTRLEAFRDELPTSPSGMEGRISTIEGRVQTLDTWVGGQPDRVAGLVQTNLATALADESSTLRVFLEERYGNQVATALGDENSPLRIAFERNANQVAKALGDKTHPLSVALGGNAGQLALALADPDHLLNQTLAQKADQTAVASIGTWLLRLTIAPIAFALVAVITMMWLRRRTAQVERAVETTVELPADLQERLDQVATGGSAYQPTIKVDGIASTPRVTAAPNASDGEPMFFIEGVGGHRSNNSVKASNVASFLKKAGYNGRLQEASPKTGLEFTTKRSVPSGALPT
jgi:hypothetical protein